MSNKDYDIVDVLGRLFKKEKVDSITYLCEKNNSTPFRFVQNAIELYYDSVWKTTHVLEDDEDEE